MRERALSGQSGSGSDSGSSGESCAAGAGSQSASSANGGDGPGPPPLRPPPPLHSGVLATRAEGNEADTALQRGYVDSEGSLWAHWRASHVVALKVLLLVSLWWLAAVEVTVVLKHAVGSSDSSPGTGRRGVFPYPLAITSLSNLATALIAIALASASRRRRNAPVRRALQRNEALKLLLLGTIQGAELASTNKSLEYLSMATRTMLGSASILFMMVTARLWGLEPLDLPRIVSAVLLTLGGSLQGLDAPDSHKAAANQASTAYLHGVMLQVATMVASAQRWSLAQFILQRSPRGSALEQMSPLDLAARVLPLTAAVCFFLALIFEREAFLPENIFSAELMFSIAAIASGVAVLTVAELRLVQLTSAVAMQVLSTLHQVPLVLAGVLLFHDTVRLASMAGFSLCIVGALCYVRARNVQQVPQSEEVALAVRDNRKHQVSSERELMVGASVYGLTPGTGAEAAPAGAAGSVHGGGCGLAVSEDLRGTHV